MKRSLFLQLVFVAAVMAAVCVACAVPGGDQVGAGSGGSFPGSGSGGASEAGSGGVGGGGGGDAGGGGSSGSSGGAPVVDAGSDDRPGADIPKDGGGSNVWTGTWAASAQSCGGGVDGRTLRNIVHTSIGGTSARIRISNTFGGGALQIRDVHVAVRTTGSSIDVATDKALTFNGQPEVTVPARMFADSDGAEFAVKPLSDVAISFFVVASGGGTCHAAAWQTNYSVAGNMVSTPTLAGAQTSTSWSYVLNLDVLNPAAEGAVVTLGASITDGFYAGSDVNKRWPNFLATRIVMANRVVGVLNQGISADGVGGAVGRFDRDVLSQPNVKWVIFSDNPINDFGRSRPSAESELTQIKGMIAKAHAKGVKFLCSTMTPYAGAEPGRTQLNALLRGADSGCDGIVPMDMATSDPAAPMRWSAAANSPDGLHPGPSGMEMMANAVDLALFK